MQLLLKSNCVHNLHI